MNRRTVSILMAGVVSTAFPVMAEEWVKPEYHPLIDLATYDCSTADQSSWIGQVCYDGTSDKLAIELNGTFYVYCEIPAAEATGVISADRPGGYYNAHIKGHFACN